MTEIYSAHVGQNAGRLSINVLPKEVAPKAVLCMWQHTHILYMQGVWEYQRAFNGA
jgi:hypothetical protein